MRSGDFKTIILAVAAAIFGVTFVLKFKPYVADRFRDGVMCGNILRTISVISRQEFSHIWQAADFSA